MNKDWIGNKKMISSTLGISSHSEREREKNDYYATSPKAVIKLIEEGGIKFHKNIWECACGEGNISDVLEYYGYNVRSTDLIDRRYGDGCIDFLKYKKIWKGDIVTNPPYKYALEFVEHALEIIPDDYKVCMFLKIQFLSSKKRRKLFDTKQLKTLYVLTSRMQCPLNGIGDYEGGAIDYCWFEFVKNYNNNPIIKWIN